MVNLSSSDDLKSLLSSKGSFDSCSCSEVLDKKENVKDEEDN